MILVTGARGNAGGAVVRALLERGQPVHALVRDLERAMVDGVHVVVGDLDRAETVKPHLEGVTGAFLLSGYDGLIETLADMRQAGLERVVLLSSSAAPSGDLTNAIARYHIRSERAVRESGLDWTFLQPNSFMTSTLRWLPQIRSRDVIRGPFAEVPIATIAPEDIGTVAAVALTGGGHAGRAYRLSGPEALRPADQVAVLADVLGRDLRFEAQPAEEARAEMEMTTPPEYVDAIFRFFGDGEIDESTVFDSVDVVNGATPRTLRQWATEHASDFR